MIASTMDPAWQLVVVAVSLATSYAIVFVAGFSRQDRRHSQQGIFQRPGVETIVTYLAALVVAALLLWVFPRGVHPPADLLSRVIVLGFPAAIGGRSAARRVGEEGVSTVRTRGVAYYKKKKNKSIS